MTEEIALVTDMRGVQCRGDVPHNIVADETGHQEDRKQEDEWLDLGAAPRRRRSA